MRPERSFQGRRMDDERTATRSLDTPQTLVLLTAASAP